MKAKLLSMTMACLVFALILSCPVANADLPKINSSIITYTPFTETYCKEGQCQTVYYLSRIFYNENNTWNLINNTFYYNGTHWVADRNNFKVYVRENIVTLKGENESAVSFTIPASSQPVVSGNTITYDISTTGSVKMTGTIILTLTSEGLEKLITINSLSTNANNPWNYAEALNKTLAKSKFIIGDLKIWYTTSNATDSWNVYYPANWNDGVSSVSFTLNKTWFLNAVYPIYIDPTVYYNFTVVNSNKAYGDSSDAITVQSPDGTGDFTDEDVPTYTEVMTRTTSNFTVAGYTALSKSDDSRANITSPGSNNEPFGKYNFTISQPKASINWIYLTMEQNEIVGAGTTEHCYYGIVNFTGSSIFLFGTYMDSTTDVTRTYNLSTAQVQDFLNGANTLIAINWATLADSGDGCGIDYVGIVVNYNSTLTYTNPTNNNSIAKPNDMVNFSITVSTSDTDLDSYLFSNNFSGSWVNSSWISISGTQTSATITNVSSSASAGAYGWRVYVNTSTGYSIASDIQTFNFTTRTLVVTWQNGSQINSTLCPAGSPCQYSQYDLFNVSANITCVTNPTGQSCGSITGGIMYNDTATTYTLVNTTNDSTPFYVTGITVTNQITCSNLTNVGDTLVRSSAPAFSYGAFYEIIVDSYTGDNFRAWLKFDTFLGSGHTVNYAINATLFLYYYTFMGNLPTGRTINLYNTTDNTSFSTEPWWEGGRTGGVCSPDACLTWNNQTTVDTLQSGVTVPASYGWMSWSIGQAINASFLSSKNISLTLRDSVESSATQYGTRFYSKETPLFEPYLTVCYNETVTTGPQNPSSIGTLNGGDSYLLNYTINASGSATQYFKFIYNFTSDASTVLGNLTADAYVRIGLGADTTPPELTVSSPTNTTFTNASSTYDMPVTYTVSDSTGVDKCWYQLDGGSNTTITNCANISVNVAIGWHSFNLSSNDTLGYAVTKQINFTYNQITDTCTYSSGNWNINCDDGCNLSTNTDLGGNSVIFSGTGTVSITALITNFNIARASTGCHVIVRSGGKLQ